MCIALFFSLNCFTGTNSQKWNYFWVWTFVWLYKCANYPVFLKQNSINRFCHPLCLAIPVHKATPNLFWTEVRYKQTTALKKNLYYNVVGIQHHRCFSFLLIWSLQLYFIPVIICICWVSTEAEILLYFKSGFSIL